jgi:hypothetical protein
VHAALDRHPIELNRDKYLKRTLALELMRLDQLEMAFEGKALRDRDVAAGVLMVKIAERRATLLGLNPSPGYAVAVIQHPPPEQKTSTQEIQAALDNVLRITVRERQLLDKEAEIGGPGVTPEESAEIDELRRARGKGPRAEDPRA